MRQVDRLKSNWFLTSMFFLIIFARLNPSLGAQGGILMPEITVKVLAVAVIFFISGLSLKSEEFAIALFQWRIHVLIQLFTLVGIPLLIQLLLPLLRLLVPNENILRGIVTLGCMPPPVSSAVILTKAVGGNEAAAIFNSALGSFLGIFVTPISLMHFVGMSTDLPMGGIVMQLSVTVVCPLLLGQIFRQAASAEAISRRSSKFSNISQGALLLIIYTTFCDAFQRKSSGTNTLDVVLTIFTVVILQALFTYILFKTATRLRSVYRATDAVCITFCGVHKSLTLGIPILRVLYEESPYLTEICLPLLIYHPTQIFLGGVLIPYMREYLKKSKRLKEYLPT